MWEVLLALSTWRTISEILSVSIFSADWAGRHQEEGPHPPDLTILTEGLLPELLPSGSFTLSLPRDSDMANWWAQHVLLSGFQDSPCFFLPSDVHIICSLPRGELLGEPVSRGLLGAEYIRLTYSRGEALGSPQCTQRKGHFIESLIVAVNILNLHPSASCVSLSSWLQTQDEINSVLLLLLCNKLLHTWWLKHYQFVIWWFCSS